MLSACRIKASYINFKGAMLNFKGAMPCLSGWCPICPDSALHDKVANIAAMPEILLMHRLACSKHRSLLDVTFFVANTNGKAASDQLFCFLNLAAWMLATFGKVDIPPAKEGSDTTAALQGILSAAGKLGLKVPASSAPARLLSGSGRDVCGMLHSLADWSLQQTKFRVEQPEHATGNDDGCALMYHCWHGIVSGRPWLLHSKNALTWLIRRQQAAAGWASRSKSHPLRRRYC